MPGARGKTVKIDSPAYDLAFRAASKLGVSIGEVISQAVRDKYKE